MTRRARILVVLAGLVLAGLGAATSNYAKSCTLAGNTAWARRHDMPAPTRGMRVGGALGAVAGFALFGMGLAARRRVT